MNADNAVTTELSEFEREALLIASHTVEPVHSVGNALFFVVERIVAERERVAAETALREAAKEWGGTERVRMETVGKWLRARADEYRIPPDRYEHCCGYDYDAWCDGCRAAYRDAGMEV